MFNIRIQPEDGRFRKLAKVVITDKEHRFLIAGDESDDIRIWVIGKRKCGVKQAIRKVRKLLKDCGVGHNFNACGSKFQGEDYMILDNKLAHGFSMELMVTNCDFNAKNEAIDIAGVKVI